MGDLFIGNRGNCIERVSKRSTEIMLLARADGTEVMTQTITSGSRFFLSADPGWPGMEFLYILDGELRWEREGSEPQFLGRGQYIRAYQLTSQQHFKAETDVTFLYVASQPVFHFMSEKIRELRKLALEVESKDMMTERHCERIQDLSLKVGEELGLQASRLAVLGYAAFFHDIGKTLIPDLILGKPGPLTPDEWVAMRRHPSYGREIVETTYLKEAGEIIEQHHERMDGSGYPLGLSGEKIMLEAQIIAVVDSFDAMTSDRPYHKGLPISLACRELRKNADILFRRDVVDAFLKVVENDVCQAERA